MDLRQELVRFRSTHEMCRQRIDGEDWTYISSGVGAHTLVLMPGGGGSAECLFPLILGFEKRCHVLSIGCAPSVHTVDEALSGIAALLAARSVPRAVLLGHSLGGMFAECFMARFPSMVSGLVLANVANYSPLRRKILGPVLGLAGHFPGWMLGRQLRAQFSRLLGGHPDREFWLGYFGGEELARMGTEGLANRAACVRDFMDHWEVGADQVARWGGSVLIFESRNESGFTKGERQALRALYPRARVHTFADAGHLSFLWRPEEFIDATLGFIDALPVARRPAQSVECRG